MKMQMVDPKSAHVFRVSQNQATSKAELVVPPEPSHDKVAKRAHEIYVEKGSEPGHCEENWQQAERDLRKATQETRLASQEMQSEGGTSAARQCAGETPGAAGGEPIGGGATSAAP